MCLFPLTASLATPHVTTLHSHFPFDGVLGGWLVTLIHSISPSGLPLSNSGVILIGIPSLSCRSISRTYSLSRHGGSADQKESRGGQPLCCPPLLCRAREFLCQ